VAVRSDGGIEAVAPGRATLTGTVGNARVELPVEVIAETDEVVALSPAVVEGRTGDVIRFAVGVPRGTNPAITWSFSPGNGMIDQDGAFVGYEAGTYTIYATVGRQTRMATVHLTPRDVRRPAEVVGRLPRTAFTTEEVWLHPNGRNLYLGTGRGGDRMYAV